MKVEWEWPGVLSFTDIMYWRNG